MRMLSVLSILAAPAAVMLATPAHAKPDETGSFEHDGYTYVYTVKDRGESQIIRGYRYPGGAAFSLRVRDGMVSGTSNGTPVHFSLSDAEGAIEEPVEIGMR